MIAQRGLILGEPWIVWTVSILGSRKKLRLFIVQKSTSLVAQLEQGFSYYGVTTFYFTSGEQYTANVECFPSFHIETSLDIEFANPMGHMCS